MKVTAKLKNLRTSPRKVRLVANLIKGMDVKTALVQLEQVIKKSGLDFEKLLKSAIANGENNFGLDSNNLFISDLRVGEGPKLKRWLPRAHGRATLLLKRTSIIDLVLEEKVEGKNRKTKEQMEKERKQREAEKQKMIDKMIKEQEKAEEEVLKESDALQEKEAKKVATPKKKTANKVEGTKGKDGNWVNKVFQRKSV